MGVMPRIALGAVAAIVLLGLSLAIAFEQPILGFGIALLAALPVMAYAAYRWPIVFPFGLYIIAVPFDPLLKTAGAGGATITRFLGAATAVALLAYAYRMRRLFAPPVSWYPWAAYLFLCCLSQAWTIDPVETGVLLAIMESLFGFYTVTAVFPITPKSYQLVRRAVVLAGLLTGLYGVYGYCTGQRLGPARLSLSVGGVHFDPNHYGAFFCIPIGIAIARLFMSRDRRERIFCALLVALMFGNVLLTGSRGALIAATLVMLYVGIRSRRFALLALTAVAGFGFTFALPNVWVRFLDPTQGDASGRGEIWSVGFAIIREYGLFGAGFGSFFAAYNENINHSIQRTFVGYGRPAHNLLIQTTAELGVAGLLFVIGGFVASFRQNAFISRSSPYFADRTAYEGALIGLFVCALTIDLMWFKYIWLCFSLIVLLNNVVRPTLLLGRRPVARMPRKRATPVGAVQEPVPL